MIKVVAHTSSFDELARSVAAPVFKDVCGAVTELMHAVETRGSETVVKVAVHEVRVPESTSFQAPALVNIGGKITHYAMQEVHAQGMRSSVQRQVNAFGVFFSVFTSAGNFHTSSTKTATLFRGGASGAAVLEAIDHVFLKDSVAEVLINNVVFSCRLGHPVSQHNAGIRRALERVGAGVVEVCPTMEDNMFVHAFVVRAVSQQWLRAHGVDDVQELHARINIGRTGVLNVFFGVGGGVPLQSALELRLRHVCTVFLDAIRAAV
jgi:hypothetical protein